MGEKRLEQMISTKELASALGVTRDFLQSAREKQGLPYYRLGKYIRYNLSEVKTWLKERKNV